MITNDSSIYIYYLWFDFDYNQFKVTTSKDKEITHGNQTQTGES